MMKQEWLFRSSIDGNCIMFVQEADGRAWFAWENLNRHYIGDGWGAMENFIRISGWFRKGIPITRCQYRQARKQHGCDMP